MEPNPSAPSEGNRTSECDPQAEPPGPGYRVLAANEVPGSALDEFANAVLEGLAERPKNLSSRFIYDDQGSRYFQEIMSLPEYYPTRCETEILETHGLEILKRFLDGPFNLVDLGSGDGAKTFRLLRSIEELRADASFMPIDISEGAMKGLTARVRDELPNIRVEGVVADYSDALRWIRAHHRGRRNLVLFLGSNIGNFDRAHARAFLRNLWTGLGHDDGLFIGFDLKKDIDRLLDAYNDSQGVTASFNLNLLSRINRELGGHFDLSSFRHYATYDVFSGAMESYLVSLVKQNVAIDALHSSFEFQAWEPIHTEYSYKYLDSDITKLAEDCGFTIEETFYDSRRWFAGSLWRACKRRSPD